MAKFVPEPRDYTTLWARPQLTPAEEQKAIQMASENYTLKQISDDLGFHNVVAFKYYRNKHPNFAKCFEDARAEGLHTLADSVMTIADDYTDPQQAGVKLKCVQWYLAVRMPETYGTKVDVNVNQTISIKSNLEAAEGRLAGILKDVTPLTYDIKKIAE